VRKAQNHYPECPEAMIVSLARTGDKFAFEELVKRKQSQVRNLMRRCCGDITLADDLAQQVFLQAWMKIRSLREPNAFSGWLKRLAITVWLQHVRKKDSLHQAEALSDDEFAEGMVTSMTMDLDRALATLSYQVRLCVVLSYQEGFSHQEIATTLEIPLGTAKSHISRGAKRLQEILAAYKDEKTMGKSQ
jgi:RNA polymerase sigma factor (sigma-70 family)